MIGRFFLTSLLAVLALSGVVSSQEYSDEELRRPFLQGFLGLGGAQPLYDTDDGVRFGVDITLRFEFHLRRTSKFGAWLGFDISRLDSDKSMTTVVRPTYEAYGKQWIDRTTSHIHIGFQWTGGTPYTRRFLPRLAIGVGPSVVTRTRQFEIADIEEGRLTLGDRNDIVLGNTIAIGFQYAWPSAKMGLGIDIVLTQAWKAEVYIPDGVERKNLTTLSFVIGFYSSQYGQRKS